MRITVFLTLMLIYCGTVYPAGEVSETGTTGMSFLAIAPSAHIASLGSGSTSLYTGSGSIWSNPALIALHDGRSIQVTHMEWVEGINQQYAAFSSKGKIGGVGLAVHLFDSGDIELRGTSPSSEPLGTYSIKNVSFSATYAANVMKNIAVGLTYKKLFEKVSMETAQGYAVDMGIIYATPLTGLSIAGTARNYGRMGKLKNDRTKLPSDMSFGCLYHGVISKFGCPFLFVGDIYKPKYGDSGLRAGVEVEPINNLRLRAGYRTDRDIQDVSFGIGFGIENLYADVSYTPMKEGFDNSIRFTLSLTGL